MLVTASFKRTAKEGSDGKMTQWVGAATIKPDVQSFLGSAGLKGRADSYKLSRCTLWHKYTTVPPAHTEHTK